jgi:hypothetical protein
MRKFGVFIVLPLAAWAVLLSGCGYAPKSLFPADIKSVQVNIFDNDSHRTDVELNVTNALTKELNVSKLKVTDTHPDSILKGTLIETKNASLVESDFGTITGGDVVLTADLKWMDARTNSEIPLRVKIVTARASFNILRGENHALAVQKAVELLAKRIVEAMEEEW